MKKDHNIFTNTLIVIGSYFLFQLYGIISAAFTKNDIYISFFATLLTLITFGIIYKDTLIKNFKTIKKDFNKNDNNIVKFVLIFYLLHMISNVIINYILFDQAANQNAIINALTDNLIIMIIYISILAPITEELVFRMPLSNTKKNRLALYIIISILFACSHLILEPSITSALIHFIPYFFLALMIGYPVYKSENIYLSMILHSINNSIVLLFLYI